MTRLSLPGFTGLPGVLCVLVLGGCATSPPIASPEQVTTQERMLTESAGRIADALQKLASVEQAAHRVNAQAITPTEIPLDLQLRVAVDYQGDIKPLVYQLAQTVGYQVKTYGAARVLAPVTIHAEDRSIGELLADVGYQASWRCDVVVVPPTKTVELRYTTRHAPSPRRPAAHAG